MGVGLFGSGCCCSWTSFITQVLEYAAQYSCSKGDRTPNPAAPPAMIHGVTTPRQTAKIRAALLFGLRYTTERLLAKCLSTQDIDLQFARSLCCWSPGLGCGETAQVSYFQLQLDARFQSYGRLQRILPPSARDRPVLLIFQTGRAEQAN